MTKACPCFVALPASFAWAILHAMPACAQLASLELPPPVQLIDENGVDLRSGQWTQKIGDIAIGAEGTVQLSSSIGISSYGADTGTPLEGRISHSICDPFGDMMQYVECSNEPFRVSIGPRTEMNPGYNGTSLESDSAGWTFRERDGTIYYFLNSYGDNPPEATGWEAVYAKLSWIKYPNGTTITYHRDSNQYVSYVTSISTNTGLYYHNGKLINLAVDYCNTDTDTCGTPSYNWPTSPGSGYLYPSWSITDLAGGVWTGTRSSTPTTTTNVRTSPLGAQKTVVMTNVGVCTFPHDLISSAGIFAATSVQENGKTYTYSYVVDCGKYVRSAVRTNPDFTTFSFTRGAGLDSDKFRMTDELGRVTLYKFDYYTVNNLTGAGADGYLLSLQKPEGDKYIYTRDYRGNVTTTTYYDKMSVSKVVRTANYPASCGNFLTCNKPSSVTDARGNTTSYTYDPAHGGVLTETSPPDSVGVQAVKRYAYGQHYAWLKNSGGGYSQASTPIWLIDSEKTCRTTATVGGACAGGASDEVVTTFGYGVGDSAHGNNLWLREKVVTADGVSLRTCYSYDPVGNKISETKPRAGLTSCP